MKPETIALHHGYVPDSQNAVALPLATSSATLDMLFDSALLQRQRLKANQQLAEWMGIA